VADDNAPLGQDQLDVAQAQAEQVVKQDGVLHDLDWEAVPGILGEVGRHLASLA
jgi:hypothetical protein